MLLPFLRLSHPIEILLPATCSVCDQPFGERTPQPFWTTQRVGTDYVALLIHSCSSARINAVPSAPSGFFERPHKVGAVSVCRLPRVSRTVTVRCLKRSRDDLIKLLETDRIGFLKFRIRLLVAWTSPSMMDTSPMNDLRRSAQTRARVSAVFFHDGTSSLERIE